MTREVKADKCPTPKSATWAERLAVARSALMESVRAKYPSNPGQHVGRALRRLAQIAQETRETAKDNFSYTVVKTEDEGEAERAFIGYLDKERGCERFNIHNSDVSYMVNSKIITILLAEVITDTRVFGFTAVKSVELPSDEDLLYFAVRLTPRKFKNPNPRLQP